MGKMIETQRVREAVEFFRCMLNGKDGYDNLSDLHSQARIIDAMQDSDTAELKPLREHLEVLKGVRNEAKDLGAMLTTLIEWLQEPIQQVIDEQNL
jgi:hypothetical protein